MATSARCWPSSALGLDENTIVMYSTDNGAETPLPDGGTTMFRGEKNTQWEAATACPR